MINNLFNRKDNIEGEVESYLSEVNAYCNDLKF